MTWNVQAVVQLVVTVLAAYVIWRVMHFIPTYYRWCKLAGHSKIPVYGTTHPFWGQLKVVKDMKGYFDVTQQLISQTRAKMYSGWIMFIFPAFIACHPDSIRALLKVSSSKGKGFSGPYEIFTPWLGDGLLVSNGKKWERNRRLLTPAFHFEILQPYIKTYNDVADIFLDTLEKMSSGGQSVEICNPVSLATLDTMMRCALSYEGRVQEEGSSHPYVTAVSRLTHLFTQRTLKPWVWAYSMYMMTDDGKENDRLCRYVHGYTENIIKARHASLEKDPSQLNRRKLDFLDILLTAKDENGQGLTQVEIRDEVDTFLFEGHDTTASAISWAIYSLAKYQDEQKIIFDELQFITKDKSHTCWEDIQKFRKISLFIKESMRMYSPVPFISRTLNEPMVFENLTIPVGTHVDINMHVLHHHPDVYPNHEIFNPRRFLEDSAKAKDPFEFIPFSAGLRNCIGQNFANNEMKVILSRLINRFKIRLDRSHEVIPDPSTIMRAKYGIKIKLEPRNM